VRRKIALFVGVASCCAVIASCGGGGNSSPTPTPTPTGTPTPTPTATPTPSFTDFDFAQAFSAKTFGTSYIFAYFAPTGGAETWNDGTRRDGQSTITYAVAPENVAFTWPDTATLMNFGAANLQTATPTLRTYRSGTEGLTLELPFEHIMRVSYERSQAFTNATVPGTLRSTRVSIFFNDVSTTSAITTNLAYAGTAQVVGGKPGATAPGVFSSELANFTVAASDKKITGTIRIFENVNGTPTLRAVLPISATVSDANSFGGSIDDTANGFKGTFIGSLAGPSREEVFIIFNVAHTDGREFIGSLIGS
jgi:hypothetical protein